VIGPQSLLQILKAGQILPYPVAGPEAAEEFARVSELLDTDTKAVQLRGGSARMYSLGGRRAGGSAAPVITWAAGG